MCVHVGADHVLSPASHDKQSIIDGKGLKNRLKYKKKGQICKIQMSSQGQSGKKMFHFGLFFVTIAGCKTSVCRHVRVAEKKHRRNNLSFSNYSVIALIVSSFISSKSFFLRSDIPTNSVLKSLIISFSFSPNQGSLLSEPLLLIKQYNVAISNARK